MSEVEEEKAQIECGRRAPLEEGRDGLMKDHFAFYFSAKKGPYPRL